MNAIVRGVLNENDDVHQDVAMNVFLMVFYCCVVGDVHLHAGDWWWWLKEYNMI